MIRASRKYVLLLASLGVLLGTGACHIEVEDHNVPAIDLVDLQVDWRILSTDSASYCGGYGIDQWLVEARGPESRDVYIDCRIHRWSSESDLYLMEGGRYSVTVHALDIQGRIIASQGTTLDLWDYGYVEQVTFHFDPADFGL